MTQDLWTTVDRYLDEAVLGSDPVLDAVLHASAAAGLPAIQVSASHGKLLMILARAIGARAILEIGTLGGYSSIWLARALPADGKLVTLESQLKHAGVARESFARAGLTDRIELRLGSALDTLPRLAQEGRGPFDLTFIDADKPNNPEYFAWALQLSRPGSLIITDNVVREGTVADGASPDPAIQATRRLYRRMAGEPRVTATVIQTVGIKGYDGFAIALVTPDP